MSKATAYSGSAGTRREGRSNCVEFNTNAANVETVLNASLSREYDRQPLSPAIAKWRPRRDVAHVLGRLTNLRIRATIVELRALSYGWPYLCTCLCLHERSCVRVQVPAEEAIVRASDTKVLAVCILGLSV